MKMDDRVFFDSFETARWREERKRDYESLKRIEDLCLQLQNELIQYNDNQKSNITPLFRADETINNIRILAKIMADRTGGRLDQKVTDEQENQE
jgi:hypothetical protein